MSNSLDDLMTFNGKPDPRYSGRVWNNNVEDFLDILRNEGNAEYSQVQDIDHVHYRYNFYGYLRDQHEISNPIHQQIILRANRMKSPIEFDERWTFICIPSESIRAKLIDTYATHR